ncbi:photosystem II stability/assembly factor-like uncharacterized protein [Salirhabdus euzebyi]|uniref:Photosystem II stability/assembly factor-like uncharacterized protein n=1 Tax=Salirhabdus euzebyi TaxID=394506 RepID=A0A841Q8H9_9BACI|nr:hypothetical protein [Salirhabdus euzebyi]MBB6454771.1 photosystem II stability/assembly factor-like uncharacterized protein [Salirhabdus euzebyi]
MSKFDEFKHIEEQLHQLPKPHLDKEADDRILSAILASTKKLEKHKKQQFRIKKIAGGFATLAFVFLFSFILYSTMHKGSFESGMDQASEESADSDFNRQEYPATLDKVSDQKESAFMSVFNGEVNSSQEYIVFTEEHFQAEKESFLEKNPDIQEKLSAIQFTDFTVKESWQGSITGDSFHLNLYTNEQDVIMIVSMLGNEMTTNFISDANYRSYLFYGEHVFLYDDQTGNGESWNIPLGQRNGLQANDIAEFITKWENTDKPPYGSTIRIMNYKAIYKEPDVLVINGIFHDSVEQEEAIWLDLNQTRKLKMVNENNGYRIDDGIIYHTSNGGDSWIPSIDYSSKQLSDFHTFEASAWAAITSNRDQLDIFSTDDFGYTWENSLSLSGHSATFSFVSEQLGWLLVRENTRSGNQIATIYETTNGGKSWSSKRLPIKDGQELYTLESNDTEENVFIFNGSTGWIAGLNKQNHVSLFLTEDRGETWNFQTIALPPEYQSEELSLQGLKFFSHSSGVLHVSVLSRNQKYDLLFETSDGGNSWSLTEQFAENNSLTFQFLNKNTWFSSDGKQLSVKKSDAEWNRIEVEYDMERILHFQFITENRGYLLMEDANNRKTILKTNDGGASWSL